MKNINENKKEEEKYTIKSLVKSFTVLELISKEKKMSIKEIDDITKLGKTTIFRILNTFKEMNYIDQDKSDNKYFVTMKILELSKNISNKLPLKDISRPFMEKLFDKCKETVNLGIIVGKDIIYLDKITTKEPLRIELEVGRKVPIYCSALGKSMLAFNDSLDISNINYEKFTSTTIANDQELKIQLNKIKEEGYAFDDEEYIYHLKCIAVPILNINNKAIASISIATPSIRLDENKKKLFIEELKYYAKEIEKEINKLYLF